MPRWMENVSKGEVVMMDKDYKEKQEMEEHVPLGCMWLLKGAPRQAHTEDCRWRFEEELRGTAKAEAAQRPAKEYQDKAAERRMKRSRAWRKVRRMRQH